MKVKVQTKSELHNKKIGGGGGFPYPSPFIEFLIYKLL